MKDGKNILLVFEACCHLSVCGTHLLRFHDFPNGCKCKQIVLSLTLTILESSWHYIWIIFNSGSQLFVINNNCMIKLIVSQIFNKINNVHMTAMHPLRWFLAGMNGPVIPFVKIFKVFRTSWYNQENYPYDSENVFSHSRNQRTIFKFITVTFRVATKVHEFKVYMNY